MQFRLDKFLSDAGIGSRKDLRELIRAGRVLLNGKVCRAPETKVNDTDSVTVDGEPILYQKSVTVMLHKPAGYLSATMDEHGDKVVTELLDARLQRMDLKPAGRLDKDATGLLILTNDGDLIHSVISPNRHVMKRYEVTLSAPLPGDAAERFRAGIRLEDGYLCLPAVLEYEDGARSAVVRIHEGKFHQVKRMFAALGSMVLTLHRTDVGGVTLDPTLGAGEYRRLTAAEMTALTDRSAE